eukprot:3138537-Prymnesium_polylepis.1
MPRAMPTCGMLMRHAQAPCPSDAHATRAPCHAPAMLTPCPRGAHRRARCAQVIAHQKYDGKCDVHSFGMLLWELTHRKLPFQGRGALQAAFAVVQGERPPIALPASELQRFGPLID